MIAFTAGLKKGSRGSLLAQVAAAAEIWAETGDARDSVSPRPREGAL